MTTYTDEYATLPRCCSFDPRMHNLLSGNVAVSTFVFLLLHPNLVCKTKMVYFGATVSTTCWTVLMTSADLWCRGNSEVKRGKGPDSYPVHEIYNRD